MSKVETRVKMLSPFAFSNYEVGAGYMHIPLTNGSQKPQELAPTVLKKLVISSWARTRDSKFFFSPPMNRSKNLP
jgi:hypothetical protein